MIRRVRSGEELSEIEQFQFQRHYNAWFRYWENMHYQYRIGLYDESEFAKHRETVQKSFSTSPGIVKYWCRVSSLYSLEFVAEIDALQTTYKREQAQRTPWEQTT